MRKDVKKLLKDYNNLKIALISKKNNIDEILKKKLNDLFGEEELYAFDKIFKLMYPQEVKEMSKENDEKMNKILREVTGHVPNEENKEEIKKSSGDKAIRDALNLRIERRSDLRKFMKGEE